MPFLCRIKCKGEAISPAYLIHTVRRLFPGLEVQQAETPENSLDLLETPAVGLDYLIWGLTEGGRKRRSPFSGIIQLVFKKQGVQ